MCEEPIVPRPIPSRHVYSIDLVASLGFTPLFGPLVTTQAARPFVRRVGIETMVVGGELFNPGDDTTVWQRQFFKRHVVVFRRERVSLEITLLPFSLFGHGSTPTVLAI